MISLILDRLEVFQINNPDQVSMSYDNSSSEVIDWPKYFNFIDKSKNFTQI